MEALCEQIKAQSAESVEALRSLQQLFTECAMEPSATDAIYQQITDNVKKSLDKMKNDCVTPLNMWRAIKGRKPDGLACSASLSQLTFLAPPAIAPKPVESPVAPSSTTRINLSSSHSGEDKRRRSGTDPLRNEGSPVRDSRGTPRTTTPRTSTSLAPAPTTISFDDAGPTETELLNMLENDSDEWSSDDEDYQTQFGTGNHKQKPTGISSELSSDDEDSLEDELKALMGGSAEDSSAKLEKKRRSLSRKKTADAVPKEAREGREGKERSSSKRDKPLATTHAVASSAPTSPAINISPRKASATESTTGSSPASSSGGLGGSPSVNRKSSLTGSSMVASLLHVKGIDSAASRLGRPRAQSFGGSLAELPSSKHDEHFLAKTSNPPVILAGNYPSLCIDPLYEDPEPPVLDAREDLFSIKFLRIPHLNFIVQEMPEDGVEAKKEVDHTVITVALAPIFPNSYVHNALLTSKKGYHMMEVKVSPGTADTLAERIESAVCALEKRSIVAQPLDPAGFSKAFATLEAKHPQKRTGIKIGVINCRAGQKSPKEMFLNGISTIHGDQCSESFWRFSNFMGSQINLSNWSGYRGDMGKEGTTYADTWNDVTVIYHLAPMMGAEGHRRLIGNDICVIFFLEEGSNSVFDPTLIAELGQVPQVFGIVQPVGEKYRSLTMLIVNIYNCCHLKLGFFHNVNLKPFAPQVPDHLLTAKEMKDMLLTKIYNGLVMTTYCPPLNRLFFIPRLQTLEAIIAQFPLDPKKTKKPKIEKKDKLKKDMKSSKDKDQIPKIDGDELIPVSKGDCWLFERESEDKPTITPELTKDVKKVYLSVSLHQISFFDQKTKAPILRIGYTNLFRPQIKEIKGHKSLTMEARSDTGEITDIVYKTVSNSELMGISQQINSCVAKLYQGKLANTKK